MRLGGVVVVVAALVGGAFALGPADQAGASSPNLVGTVLKGACALDLRVGFSHCNLQLLGNPDARPHASGAPSGYGPADLQSAYGLRAASGSAGATQTVAIVDAYDDPSAESNMNSYRATFGLPACTTASGCFKKVNQNGIQGSYPSNNQSWGVEISLDLDMVSATCPKCHVLLVEATSNASANLYASVDTAARLGATEISNSYGGSESSADLANNSHYNHPGVAITASSGDSGYGVQFPAASPYVTAVGGTTLSRSGSGFIESAWSGSGSGCSAFEPKQSWQQNAGCGGRTVADVSAVADPATGVAVYDTNCSGLNKLLGSCFSGWGVVGGTSASSPIIASVYALAGNASSVTYGSYPYSHTTSLHDVTSGSNGTCSPAYLCTAGSGYDGPTGNGTPAGTGAF